MFDLEWKGERDGGKEGHHSFFVGKKGEVMTEVILMHGGQYFIRVRLKFVIQRFCDGAG